MARPLSLDLRKRIVEAVEDGATYEEAARRFGITDEDSLHLLRELVKEKPDRLVVELKELFEERSGKSTSESGIKRALRKLGLRRKKKGFVATERGSERVQKARKAFMAWMPHLDARRLVFIDETWTSIGMARPYARSPRGQVVTDDIPSVTHQPAPEATAPPPCDGAACPARYATAALACRSSSICL